MRDHSKYNEVKNTKNCNKDNKTISSELKLFPKFRISYNGLKRIVAKVRKSGSEFQNSYFLCDLG